MKRTILLLVLFTSNGASAQVESSVRYLADEGVMVTHQNSKILIDPLFRNSFDQYQLVPDNVRNAIFAGQAPYDAVDAVHIPHAGWPTGRTDVQNIAFRITPGDDGTVLHLGDADARMVNFAANEEYRGARSILPCRNSQLS